MKRYNANRTRTSIIVLQAFIAGLCLIVIGRIFYLQIIDYKTYEELGDRNSIRQEYIEPARGLIYDRNHKLIVDNQPTYSLTITPSNFDEQNIPLLAQLLNVPDSLIISRVKEARRYSWYRTSRLITDIDFMTFSAIEENIWRLPGVGHQIDSKRNYPAQMIGSHIFGYLREASESDYANSATIRLGDKIGKSGLELVYEDSLKGKLGVNYLKVNAFGQSLGNYTKERSAVPPIQGSNLITTIDSDLQYFAEQLMVGKSGGLIAMNPNTGEILALVSSPEYEVSRLAGRIDSEYWHSINTDSTKPLFNRAISSRQPPGSTIKPLMGMIGLDLGIVTPKTEIYNSGAYMRGRAYNDLADIGNYNLEKAIAYSSNTYFLALMDRIAMAGKLNEWSERVKDFGLGVPNAIDLPSANMGIVPDSTYLDTRFGVKKWSLGDVLNLGIGQGLVSSSPLQIAQMTSSIANGGYRIAPHLIMATEEPNGTINRTKIVHEKIEWVKDIYIETVKKGMRRVVLEGSGRFYGNVPGIEVAGKTGTAQNPFGQDHGWFTSFAPLDDPQIVVTVFLENSGFGSISAAPVASLIIEKHLTGEIKRNHVYNYVLNFVPRPQKRSEND
ncbi:MAG: penicillin-binding protein 2 [Balneolaceae bacterium]